MQQNCFQRYVSKGGLSSNILKTAKIGSVEHVKIKR